MDDLFSQSLTIVNKIGFLCDIYGYNGARTCISYTGYTSIIKNWEADQAYSLETLQLVVVMRVYE